AHGGAEADVVAKRAGVRDLAAALEIEGRLLQHDPTGIARRQLFNFNRRRVTAKLRQRQDAGLHRCVVVSGEGRRWYAGKARKRLVLARPSFELAARSRFLTLAFHRSLEPFAIE